MYIYTHTKSVYLVFDISNMCDMFICVTWLIRMCDMTHLYVWPDSFVCVTWRIHLSDLTRLCDMTWHNQMCYLWPASFIFVTYPPFIPLTDEIRLEKFESPDRTFSCIVIWVQGTPVDSRENVCEKLGTLPVLVSKRGLQRKVVWKCDCRNHLKSDLLCPWCATWLVHTRDMMHAYAWQDLSVCVMWRIYTCGVTYSCTRHAVLICELICEMRHAVLRGVTWLIHTCDITHSYLWQD